MNMEGLPQKSGEGFSGWDMGTFHVTMNPPRDAELPLHGVIPQTAASALSPSQLMPALDRYTDMH